MNAKMAPFLYERCSRSSIFPDGVFGLPLKARYSGGVRGVEGTQDRPHVREGNAREAGTPGPEVRAFG